MNLASIHVYWFVVPLVIAISLVYSASRYEAWGRIVSQATRLSGMIFTVLIVTTVVLLLVNTMV